MFGFKEAAGVLADGLTGAGDRHIEAMKGAADRHKEAAGVLADGLTGAADRHKEAADTLGNHHKKAADVLGSHHKEAAEVLADGMKGAADRLVSFGFTLVLAAVSFGLLVSRSPPVEAIVGGFVSLIGNTSGGGFVVGVLGVAVVVVLGPKAASMISRVLDRSFH
jgi:hypothetical protein